MASSFISKLMHNVTAVLGTLPQTETNGGSKLGTMQAPTFPPFLTNNPIYDGYPWGGKTATNTDPYTDSPNTGVVRSYDLTISRGRIAPDGLEKSVILINGQFPGPTIEANWGDTIQVTAHNEISDPPEGTTLHWHGFLQQLTQWQDGIPAISQCPIAPGSSYTYTFRAQLYGTSWYHSHYSSQYAGGLYGPLIVHGPQNVDYDIDLGPVSVSDWYHRDYYSILEDVMGTDPSKVVPTSDNNLINGKMDFDCDNTNNESNCTTTAGLSKFTFTTGKKHRLRIINTSAAATQKFSIDGHQMVVMANDFVPVQPYNTSVVTLGVGQRTDIIVEATGKPTDAYWMRSTIASCSTPASQPYALAIIYYDQATASNSTALPNSTSLVDNSGSGCTNDPLSETIPYFPISPGGNAEQTINLDITSHQNETGHTLWYMNGKTARYNYNKPILLAAKNGNASYDSMENVYSTGDNASVRIVVRNWSGAAHPMHFHGHNMYVLASGYMPWDGSITRPDNPQRRDVQLMPPGGFLVMQYNADNPGTWPFHCHIAWHVSAGFQITLLENPNSIRNLSIPDTSYQLCNDWNAFTSQNVPDQIDSGE